MGGRGSKSGMSKSSSGGEHIQKDGVEYEKISGAGWGSDFARTDGYGMSGNGEKPTVDKIFNRGVNAEAYDMIDNMRFGSGGASEKYAQVEDLANGKIYGTSFTPADLMMRADPGKEYMVYNRNGTPVQYRMEKLRDTEKSLPGGGKSYGADYHDGRMQLIRDLGPSGIKQIESALQRQAKKWLADNPNMSGQKGYRFNGKKWVKK